MKRKGLILVVKLIPIAAILVSGGTVMAAGGGHGGGGHWSGGHGWHGGHCGRHWRGTAGVVAGAGPTTALGSPQGRF